MDHVFISYTRDDAEFAALIETELLENGHAVWRDTSSILGGEEWQKEIEKALDTAYAFLVVVSKISVESEWVKREIVLANRSPNRIPIIPVRLDQSELPIRLSRHQTVDFSMLQQTQGLGQIRSYRESLKKLLRGLENARPVLRYLRELKDSADEIRENAALELGKSGDPIAVPALIAALSDPDVDVRFEATKALGQLKSKSSAKQLIRLLNEDEDPDICAAAATTLGEIGLPSAIGPLIKKLDDPDRFVRASAARALGKLREMGAVEPLIHLMRNDGISDVREAATEALCEIGGSEAERAIRRVGIDPEKFRQKPSSETEHQS